MLKNSFLNQHLLLKGFYSRYYWLMFFVEEYKLKFGSDAGLEQQLFTLVEESESLSESVDCSIIEEIENSIKNKPN